MECLFCNGDCPIHSGFEGDCSCDCHRALGQQTLNCDCCDLPAGDCTQRLLLLGPESGFRIAESVFEV